MKGTLGYICDSQHLFVLQELNINGCHVNVIPNLDYQSYKVLTESSSCSRISEFILSIKKFMFDFCVLYIYSYFYSILHLYVVIFSSLGYTINYYIISLYFILLH